MLGKEGAIGSRTLPLEEASRDVESGKEIPNEEDGYNLPVEKPALGREDSGWRRPPTPVHLEEGHPARGELRALQEDKEDEQGMTHNTVNKLGWKCHTRDLSRACQLKNDGW